MFLPTTTAAVQRLLLVEKKEKEKKTTSPGRVDQFSLKYLGAVKEVSHRACN